MGSFKKILILITVLNLFQVSWGRSFLDDILESDDYHEIYYEFEKLEQKYFLDFLRQRQKKAQAAGEKSFSLAVNPEQVQQIRMRALGHFPGLAHEKFEIEIKKKIAKVGQRYQYDQNSSEDLTLNLGQKNFKFIHVLNLMAAIPNGTKVIAPFIQKLNNQELKLAPFSEKLRQEHPFHSALFDPLNGTIYLSYHEELGYMAIALFHEIIHALDREFNVKSKRLLTLEEVRAETIRSEYRRMARKHDIPVSQVKERHFTNRSLKKLKAIKLAVIDHRDKCHFQAERLAYDESYHFAAEIYQKFESYRDFVIRRMLLKKDIGHSDVTDEQIIKGYLMDPENFVVPPKD